MRRLSGFGLAWLAGTLVSATPSMANDALIDQGRRIAESHCSACHATGPQDRSPQRRVIPFRDLHQRLPIDMLDGAMKSGIIAGHDEMPMFELGTDNARALLAYVQSLWPANGAISPDSPRPK